MTCKEFNKLLVDMHFMDHSLTFAAVAGDGEDPKAWAVLLKTFAQELHAEARLSFMSK